MDSDKEYKCTCYGCSEKMKPTPIHASFLYAVENNSGINYFGFAKIQEIFLQGYHDAERKKTNLELFNNSYYKGIAYTAGHNFFI